MCNCSSVFLIVFSSLIYLLFGLAIAAAGIAAMVTDANTLIPNWYSGIALGIGVVIILFAVVGFVGACRKEKKCCLTIFMIFTFIIFLTTLTAVIFMFKTDEAVELAKDQHFVDLEGIELAAGESLRNGLDATWESCNATVVPAATAGMYVLECQTTSDVGGFLDTLVNENCLADAVDPGTGTTWTDCYSSDSWWAPAASTIVAGVINTNAAMNTPKGVFCQCYDEMADFVHQYFAIGKWISVGICAFYFLVFFSCCYLCCCAKNKLAKDGTEMKGAFFARP